MDTKTSLDDLRTLQAALAAVKKTTGAIDSVLEQMRREIEIVENFQSGRSSADGLDMITHMHRIVELFVALDDWLSAGGYLPRDWEHNTREQRR